MSSEFDEVEAWVVGQLINENPAYVDLETGDVMTIDLYSVIQQRFDDVSDETLTAWLDKILDRWFDKYYPGS